MSSSSADESAAQRSLSINIPSSSIHGPYCPRRPNLREILANKSDPPWTLTAFTAYLSSNHCLETLEFTMDAGRYKKHYEKMMKAQATRGSVSVKEREYVKQLWLRLVEAYIQPSGTREVNLHSDVRDPLLNIPDSALPPPPSTLDRAVSKIYELMEDSVLVPFLNSVCPGPGSPYYTPEQQALAQQQHQQQHHSHHHGFHLHPHHQQQQQQSHHSTSSEEDRFLFSRRARHNLGRKSPSPPSRPTQADRFSTTSSHSSTSSAAGAASGSGTNRLWQTTSSPAAVTFAPEVTMGDDGMDIMHSPVASSSAYGGRHGSPPLSDVSASSPVLGSSPKRDSGMWRKLGRLSGMSSSGGGHHNTSPGSSYSSSHYHHQRGGGSNGSTTSSGTGSGLRGLGRKKSEGGLKEGES